MQVATDTSSNIPEVRFLDGQCVVLATYQGECTVATLLDRLSNRLGSISGSISDQNFPQDAEKSGEFETVLKFAFFPTASQENPIPHEVALEALRRSLVRPVALPEIVPLARRDRPHQRPIIALAQTSNLHGWPDAPFLDSGEEPHLRLYNVGLGFDNEWLIAVVEEK